MKRKILVFSLIFLIIAVSAFALFWFKNRPEKILMDELGPDGKYHYQNKDLGFALSLPAEFEYYQAQRRETPASLDLEIFVPTADEHYREAIPPSYGLIVSVKIFSREEWEKITDELEKAALHQVGEKYGRIYALRFWSEAPLDWREKWNEEMKKEIIDSFKFF